MKCASDFGLWELYWYFQYFLALKGDLFCFSFDDRFGKRMEALILGTHAIANAGFYNLD
jgi:hypothetical protein